MIQIAIKPVNKGHSDERISADQGTFVPNVKETDK